MSKAPTPRTVEQIDGDIKIMETALIESRRLYTLARSRLPHVIAAGDERLADQCRAQEAQTDAEIQRLTKRLEELRQSRGSAKARDQGDKRLSAYKIARTALAEARRNVAAIDELTEAWAAGISTAILGISAADAAMQRAGVRPMRDLLSEQMIRNTADMKMYVSTDSKFGRKVISLYSLEELLRSGKASLTNLAANYEALYIQHAARELGINHEAA